MVEESKDVPTTTTSSCEAAQSESGKTPTNLVSIDWHMFKKEQELGEGTFGTVFKVKCLKSTVVSGEDGQRVAIEHKTQGQARRMLNMTQQVNLSTTDGKRKEKTMLQDQYYVVKVIDTSRM